MHSKYFDKFPKVAYDINNTLYSTREAVTNIFFRLGIMRQALQNSDAYYVYDIGEGDTPEIVAEKVYGDSGAGWLILYANQMIDPQFDWYLDYEQFNKYVASKYRRAAAAALSITTATDAQSLAWSKTNYHHYDQVITRTNNGDTVDIRRIQISKERLTENDMLTDFSYYDPYYENQYVLASSLQYRASSTENIAKSSPVIQAGSLAFNTYYNTYNVDGRTVIEEIKGEAVSFYDYDFGINESRRSIKVIKSQYYDQIMSEFNNLTRFQLPYIRRLA